MIFFQQRSGKSHKEKRGLGIHQVSHQSITVNTGSRGNIPAPGKESIPPPRPYFLCQIQHPAGSGAKQPHPQETAKNGCSYCTSQCSMGNYSGTNAQSSHHSRAKAVSQRAPGNKSLVGPRRCLGKKQNTCEHKFFLHETKKSLCPGMRLSVNFRHSGTRHMRVNLGSG